MADRMVASAQAEALNALLKSMPMGRYGRAEEIADVVLWLCSRAASYVTGKSISVDGDFIMRLTEHPTMRGTVFYGTVVVRFVDVPEPKVAEPSVCIMGPWFYDAD